MYPIKNNLYDMLEQFIVYLRIEKGLSNNTIDSYTSDLKIFFTYLLENKHTDINLIDRNHISGFCQKRSHECLSAKSLHRNLSSLRRFFRFLRKENKIQLDPTMDIDLPKVEKKLPRSVSTKEINSLLSSPSILSLRGIRDAAIIAIMYASGLRVFELINLRTDDIDLMRGFLRVTGKGKKDRVVPLNEKAISLLAKYIEQSRIELLGQQQSDILFIRKNGLSLSRQSVWKIIKKYARLSGLKDDFSPHQLRHSFATHLLEGGVNLRALQLMMGHSDLATTEVYMSVDKKRLLDLYDKYHPRSKV